jgi:hypothetical protein
MSNERTIEMKSVRITRKVFSEDALGRTFADVLNDPNQPLDAVFTFFSDSGRQRRMEDSEIHHDRPPLAGVVRELEAHPEINAFLTEVHAGPSKRLRQCIGVVVRIIMQSRGWKKTGKKGSLGVRSAKSDASSPVHNTGGLAFWFLRGERYELEDGMPYLAVKDRCKELEARPSEDSTAGKRSSKAVRKKATKRSGAATTKSQAKKK